MSHSRFAPERPKPSVVLDRRQLLASIEPRLSSSADSMALLLLVVLDDTDGRPASNEITERVAERIGAMIRSSDLIAALDPGEIALVVFDLPAVQRRAFADGIRAGVQGVLDSFSPIDPSIDRADVLRLDGPNAILRARVGSASLTSAAAITVAFREADRSLHGSSDVPTIVAVP